MSYNFLDKTGLTHFWDKIKTYILKNTAPLVNGTQTASTSAWTGVAPFASLEDGQVINYYLPLASTNTSVTLNLTLSGGGTTGALPVYYQNGTDRMTTHFGRGSVITLMYRTSRVNSSGTTVTNSWYHLADRDTTDVQTLRIENGSAKAGTNGIMNYALCAMDNTGKFQSFVTTSGTGTSKTVNTSAKFRNPMVILRNTANTAYTNNAEVGSGYNTNITQRFDVRYSCNGFGSFTKNMPIYLECTKDSDGYLSVTANLLTQTFTSGKYYVLVGHCCRDSVNYMYLMPDHPVYYYNGTNLIDENELKVNKESGKGLSTNDYTTAEKEKLAGIAEGATAVTVDSAWSDTSTNPIQNKMIKEALTHFQGELSELEENAQQAISGLDSSKAPKASPTFTGTPKAPTATAGTNTTQIATTAFVQTAVSGKVDKVSGKGLSTNDYTTTEKNKLAGIASGATANTGTVTSVSVKMNNTTKGTVTTSGTIDLGTVITTVDDEFDSSVSATNPVQNWVISSAIDALDGEISETYEMIPQTIYSRLNSATISSATIDSIVNGTYGS